MSDHGQAAENVHDALGGEPFFSELIDHFYAGVAMDPLLRPLYPDDLTDSKRHMVLFLQQYWGGPGTYSEERGHPRLRMRHAPFVIGPTERDAWLRHMHDAIARTAEDHGTRPDLVAQLVDYVDDAADFLVNTR